MKRTITLAAGCFWGTQAYFDKQPGVLQTTVGYANGDSDHVTYAEVCTGKTGFVEACQIVFDDQVTSMKTLLKKFFGVIDPTSWHRQGPDVGSQYRTGIYYNPADKKELLPIIEEIIQEEQTKYHHPVVTEVEALQKYIPAENYHQKYLKKHPYGYCHIDLDKK